MKEYDKKKIYNYLKQIIILIAEKNINGVYLNFTEDYIQLRIGKNIEYESYISPDNFKSKLDRSFCDWIDKRVPIWELLEKVKQL